MTDPRPNIFADRFSIERGRMRAEPLARQAGADQLGGTLYEMAPGSDDMPLHIHHGMEEMVIVLAGTPTLRTLDGDEELAPGDVVSFPRGRKGAHSLVNRSDAPTRHLMLSNKVWPELVEYPEQGVVGVMTCPPFSEPGPGEDPADFIRLRFNRSDAQG